MQKQQPQMPAVTHHVRGKTVATKKDHGKLKENGLNTWKKEPATANAVAGEGKIAVTAVL